MPDGRKKIVAPAPVVDSFQAFSVTFLRGEGVPLDPVRQCTAYYRHEGETGMSLIAVYDPEVGIDPIRFPPSGKSVRLYFASELEGFR